MLETYDLSVDIFESTADRPVVGATVTAVLDRVEVDSGYVVQRRVEAVTDAAGSAVLALWPTARGSSEARYIVYAQDRFGAGLFEVGLDMPARDCRLSDEAGAPVVYAHGPESTLAALQRLRDEIVELYRNPEAGSGDNTDVAALVAQARTAADDAQGFADDAGTARSAATDSVMQVLALKDDVIALKAEVQTLIDNFDPGDGTAPDTVDPITVTLTDRIATVASPTLAGSVSGNPDSVTASVADIDYPSAISGTAWTLAAGTIADLANGDYPVTVTAKKAGTPDATATATLSINVPAPAFTLTLDTPPVSDDPTPTLTGSVSDPNATIEVTLEALDTAPEQEQEATDAVRLDGNTGLFANNVDFVLDKDKAWAFGGWFAVSDVGDNTVLLSSRPVDYQRIRLSYRPGTSDTLEIKLAVLFNSKTANLTFSEVSGRWAFIVYNNDPVNAYVRERAVYSGADAVLADTADFATSIAVDQWVLGRNVSGISGGVDYIGNIQNAFVFTDTAISDAQMVAIAQGQATVADLGSALHHWPLQGKADLADIGSAGVDMAVDGDAPTTTTGPDYIFTGTVPPDTGGEPGDGGDGGDGNDGAIDPPPPSDSGEIDDPTTWAESTQLTPGATGDPVVFSAALDGDTVTATSPPGHRTRTRWSNGDFAHIAIRHFADGAVCIEHPYLDKSGTAALTNVSLVLASDPPITLFDDAIDIGCRQRSHPFWYIDPPVQTLDASKVPRYGTTGANASMYGEFVQRLDANGRQNPMSGCFARKYQGGTGDFSGLGLLPKWDAIYVVNPTADNAKVVRGAGDAVAPWPWKIVDPQTNRMMLSTDHKKASLNNAQSSNWLNPIQNDGPTPFAPDVAHMPAFGYLASLLFDTEFDREECEFCANYQLTMWDNSGYRYDDGYGAVEYFRHQTRGQAWTIRQGAQAWAVTRDYKDYFAYLLDGIMTEAVAVHAAFDQQGVIQASPHRVFGSNYYDGDGHSGWQNDFLCASVGLAAQLGLPKADTLIGYLGQYVVDRINTTPYELASSYVVRTENAQGRAATFRKALEITAGPDGNGYNATGPIRAGLQEVSGTLAMQDAINNELNNRVAGAFRGYPADSSGYPAYMRMAIAYARRFNVANSEAAWNTMVTWDISDYEDDPRFEIVP